MAPFLFPQLGRGFAFKEGEAHLLSLAEGGSVHRRESYREKARGREREKERGREGGREGGGPPWSGALSMWLICTVLLLSPR